MFMRQEGHSSNIRVIERRNGM